MSTKHQATIRANASQQQRPIQAAEPAAAAAEDGATPRIPRFAAAPWSMPVKFLNVPKSFSCPGSTTRIDMRSKSHTQLMALAARHNSRQGIREDPFEVGGSSCSCVWLHDSPLFVLKQAFRVDACAYVLAGAAGCPCSA
jgi:hypothetical protein